MPIHSLALHMGADMRKLFIAIIFGVFGTTGCSGGPSADTGQDVVAQQLTQVELDQVAASRPVVRKRHGSLVEVTTNITNPFDADICVIGIGVSQIVAFPNKTRRMSARSTQPSGEGQIVPGRAITKIVVQADLYDVVYFSNVEGPSDADLPRFSELAKGSVTPLSRASKLERYYSLYGVGLDIGVNIDAEACGRFPYGKTPMRSIETPVAKNFRMKAEE